MFGKNTRLVEVDAREVVELLRKRGEAIENLGRVNETAAQMLLGFVEDEFESEGRGRWPDLAESTKKRRRGSSYKILQDTTDLAQSHATRAGADFVEVFTHKRYALPHLTGGQDGNWILPQRDFHDIDRDEFMRSYADLLLQELAR